MPQKEQQKYFFLLISYLTLLKWYTASVNLNCPESSVQLNYSIEPFCFPRIGFGTASLTPHYESILSALHTGYRLIDTASQRHHAYNSVVAGRALKDILDIIPREEIFITTKNNIWAHGYNSTIQDIHNSCRILNTNYFDLYLIHHPPCMSDYCEGTWRETWRAMEDVFLEGISQIFYVYMYDLETPFLYLRFLRILYRCHSMYSSSRYI